MEGRDITTVVFPDAEIQIYLDADPKIRAERRYKELQARGDTTQSYDQVLSELKLRDHNDSTRPYMPLRQAEDAMLIDTSALSIEQALDVLLSAIAQKEAERA